MKGFSWLLLWLPLLAWAGQEEGLFDRVSLHSTASEEVENDRMAVRLAAQSEDRDPARLAGNLNRTMQWALERVRRVPGVEAKTAGYRTHPVYRDGSLNHWRGEQTLLLESGDFAALSGLLGELQSRLALQSMGFDVSAEVRRETENRLIDEALEAFKARADRVNRNLGGGGWRVVQLDIGTGTPGPGPVRLHMEAARAAAPATEAGRSEVTVTVSGTVQLLPGSARSER